MEHTWKTTVNELIYIFRGALTDIIPWINKAKIKWKEGESYDDWDNISSALYENIICTSLYSEVLDSYPMAKYLYGYDDYVDLDHIRVKDGKQPDKDLAFISFQTNFTPLDSLKVAILDKSDKVCGHSTLNYKDMEFIFVRYERGEKILADTIEVSL